MSDEDNDRDAAILEEAAWNESAQQESPPLEGYFDYKNLMINPASELLTLSEEKAEEYAKNIFKLINRDLQLGNIDERTYNIVFLHMHLATELLRFGIWEAALTILQKAYILMVLSNSRGGKLREWEATSIKEHRIKRSVERSRGSWLRGSKQKSS